MQEISYNLNPRYVVDEKGQKNAVLLDIKEYRDLLELIEDMEDTRDIIKAELEAIAFTPYEEFRKRWLS